MVVPMILEGESGGFRGVEKVMVQVDPKEGEGRGREWWFR